MGRSLRRSRHNRKVPSLETKPYRVSRLRLAYLTAEEYLRTFWFFVAGAPLGGLLLLFSQDRTMQAIGFFGIVWPFSIPARAIMVSCKASRLFDSGVVLRVGPEELEFLGQKAGKSGKPLRMAIHRDMVRDVVTRQGMLLLRLYRQSIVPVDPESFASEDDRTQFLAEFTPA